ncbi:MAG TPA: iron chelate uptake ABC transporter family permease subunit [Armatimonadota bacterium]|jgi:iron complex transport system permease protein
MPQLLTRRAWLLLPVLGALLLVSMVLSAGIGTVSLHAADIVRAVWHHLGGPMTVSPEVDSIVWELRLPRIALALLVGASLSVAGMLMQSLFHNPMADPYIVGVSSGAAVGAVVAMALGLQNIFFGLDSTALFAFVGGVSVTFIVYALARRGGRVPISTLLLTGIAIGGLMQAVTTLLILQQPNSDLRQVMVWLMGGLSDANWQKVGALLPYTFIGTLLAVAWRRDLNILALGDEAAHHLGINLERTKLLLLLIASFLAASAVAVSGVIAFVGLIVPHLMRLLIGPDHRVLLPACLLSGGLLLVWSDVLARTISPGQEVPIGIVTSVLGCLFFLYLLNRREGRVF